MKVIPNSDCWKGLPS